MRSRGAARASHSNNGVVVEFSLFLPRLMLTSRLLYTIHIAESNKNRKQPTKCPEKKIGLSYCPNSGRKDDGDLHTMKIKIALGRFFMEMDGKSCDFTQAGPDSRSLFFLSHQKKASS